MEAIYLLIPMSVLLVFIIALLFWKSVHGGQFDDLEGPAFQVLMDDDVPNAEAGRAKEKQCSTKSNNP